MPPKILIVDDEEAVLSTVSSFLHRAGFVVVACSSTEAALAELNNSEKFDILLTDVYLGEEASGYKLAQTIADRWPETKILSFGSWLRTLLMCQVLLFATSDIDPGSKPCCT